MSPFLYTCCHLETTTTSERDRNPISRPHAGKRSGSRRRVGNQDTTGRRSGQRHIQEACISEPSMDPEQGSAAAAAAAASQPDNEEGDVKPIQDMRSRDLRNEVLSLRERIADENLGHQTRTLELRRRLENESVLHQIRSEALRNRLDDVAAAHQQRQQRQRVSSRRRRGDSGDERAARRHVGSGSNRDSRRGGSTGGGVVVLETSGRGSTRDETPKHVSHRPSRDNILNWIGELRSSLSFGSSEDADTQRASQKGGSADKKDDDAVGKGKAGSRASTTRSRHGHRSSVAKDETAGNVQPACDA